MNRGAINVIRSIKKIIVFAMVALNIPVNASAFETSKHIQMDGCTSAACVDERVKSCVAAAEAEGDAYLSSRWCSNVAFEQADELLNAFYQDAMKKTISIALEMSVTPMNGHEDLLRQSQRAWLEVRDTTCELNVLYGFIGSGADTVIAQFKARMTMQRIGDLNTEIGRYLN